jgi:predicted transcriptional regulator
MANIGKSIPVPDSAVDAFRERLAAALRRRVGAHTGLTVKHLAYLCQASEQLVWTWMAGEKMPSGPKLVKLISLFDASFVHEILTVTGKGVYDLADKRADAEAKRIRGLAAAWRMMAAVAPAFDETEAAE